MSHSHDPQAFSTSEGVELQHVKPHGALYNIAAVDELVDRGMVDGLLRLPEPRPGVLALAGSPLSEVARAAGLDVYEEAFADRAYTVDGKLLSRGQAGSVIEDPDAIARVRLRALR